MSVKSQQAKRREAEKMREEDVILRWHVWGYTPERIANSGKGILTHYDTLAKIKKVLRKNGIA